VQATENAAARVGTAAAATGTPANSSMPSSGPVTPQSVLSQQSGAMPESVALDMAEQAEANGEPTVRRRGRPPAAEKASA
jgi:hypothetical protein